MLPTIIIKDRFFYQNYYNKLDKKLVGYMQNSISAFDAKTHFSKILDRASKGEEILITKRGKVTAKIVPVSLVKDIDSAQMAAIRIRKLAKEINFQLSDWEDFLSYKDVDRVFTKKKLK
jgi:prevent-host-death family protein